MTAEIRLLAPHVFGNCTIIPVVSDITISCRHGVVVSVRPVALLIGKGENWGVALLEEVSVNALLKKIVLPV
jgi:hypothetical protein